MRYFIPGPWLLHMRNGDSNICLMWSHGPYKPFPTQKGEDQAKEQGHQSTHPTLRVERTCRNAALTTVPSSPLLPWSSLSGISPSQTLASICAPPTLGVCKKFWVPSTLHRNRVWLVKAKLQPFHSPTTLHCCVDSDVATPRSVRGACFHAVLNEGKVFCWF